MLATEWVVTERRQDVQYELYIDLFFLVNFMMDYILLMLLRRMLLCTASQGRVIFGAAAGAAMTCLVIAAPIPWAAVKLLLLHGAVNVVMLKAGLCVEWGRSLLKAFLFLYIGGFLLGGIMSFLRQYVRYASLFFVLALGGYLLASGAWSLMETLIRYNRSHCTAVIYKGDKSCRVKALVDTGNRLKDARTGKPVSIIGLRTAESLGFSEDLKEPGMRYIPYHSIGKENGALPLFEIDGMRLAGAKGAAEVKQPLLAVCGEELGSDGYGMILNPELAIGL